MWNVPADHEIFQRLNTAQWMWYFHNFMEDRDEAYTNNRDMVEYHASFIEPEAVRKIRDARKEAIKVPDDQFKAGLRRMFGRDISGQRQDDSKVEQVDATSAIANYNRMKKEQQVNVDKKGLDYKRWLDYNLE